MLVTTTPTLINQEGFLANLLNTETRDSPAQTFISEEGIPNTCGHVLGGSNAINAGFYNRADSDFFAWSNMLLPTTVSLCIMRRESRLWSTFDDTSRKHISDDLLRYARASNIKVGVYASVERLLLAASSAIGVLYRDQEGDYHHAFLREQGEVILSAGAIGSPQLLLLSGIGPRPYLSSWGIPVAHHLPYVGHFLYDNPRNGITILPSLPLEHSLIQVVGITESGAYIEAASNVVPFTSPPHTALVLRSPLYLTVATIISKISGPVSSGFLRLASTEVKENPVVRFNYLNNQVDVERCVNGTRKIAEILRSRALRDFKFSNWFGERDFRFIGPALPLHQSDFPSMADYCRRTVSTIWHYHGGCVVGRVVDPNLNLIGISSLRIVDGSVFSVSPGTNPQATLMMLGRYFGLKIIAERDANNN